MRIKQLFELKRLWRRACKYDGIPESSRFVVWSETNHWAVRYNQLMLEVYAKEM